MTLRSRFCKGYALKTMTALAAGLVLSTAAHAQSPSAYLYAFQGIYAANGGSTGPFTGVTGNGTPTFSSDPWQGSASFTGLDSRGQQQTMTINGTAYSSAGYGDLHAYGAGTITNPYYNPANPAYVNPDWSVNTAGSPDTLSVHGNAGWVDTFTYTGLTGPGYYVNYLFQLDGFAQGDAAAGLNFTMDGPGGGYYGPRTTEAGALWSTPDFQVYFGEDYGITADFFGGITSDVRNHPEGVDYSGYGDYSMTLKLVGIEIKDSQGNLASGWSLKTASGTFYPLIEGSPTVPEPGSLALFVGLGLAGGQVWLRRRKG